MHFIENVNKDDFEEFVKNNPLQIKSYMFIKFLFSGFTVISTEIICG